MCKHDGEIDSMNHILTECLCPGQALVWEAIGRMWKERANMDFPKQCIGSILGSTLTTIRDANGRSEHGLTRLYRIGVTEAAMFIWTLRCERVIRNNDVPHNMVEIANRWTSTITKRAELDLNLTNCKLGKKSIPILLVLNTWDGTGLVELEKWQSSPGMTNGGVLVGSRLDLRMGVG